MEYELVPLHKNKDHFDDCCAILNAEWPRSKAAREHSLSKSCDSLPCCLVYRHAHSQEVVGFCQVVAVQGKGRACLLESVIIRHDLRGTGLGRKLMEASEQFVRRKDIISVYLNTLDKEGFYSHLGYTRCGPVISLGANASRLSDTFLKQLTGSKSESGDHQLTTNPSSAENNEKQQSKATTVISTPFSPLPSSGPLPPPPPPPPPLPSPNRSQEKGGLSRHVIRMDPNAVTWMFKQL